MTHTASDAALAMAMAALVGLASPALAQAGANATGKEIVVEAPRTAPGPAPAERSPYTGAPIITTTVRITAGYGDLDLAKPADAARLQTRVEHVAQAACKELDRLRPLAPDPTCVAMAVAKARPAVEQAIAAAAR